MLAGLSSLIMFGAFHLLSFPRLFPPPRRLTMLLISSCLSFFFPVQTFISHRYTLLEIIGSGSFGTVRKCQDKETGEIYAVKSILKSNVDDVDTLSREIAILKEVQHPNIIQLIDVYEDTEYIHIVTELCTGGELYDMVLEKADSEDGHFLEYDAALLIRDIVNAIEYCHNKMNIVHRDLKPENFLLKDKNNSTTDHMHIKIIDFGLSRKVSSGKFSIMNTRVGSPYYVAPEILHDNPEYTSKCDMWSIGIIAYILLCGFPPFDGNSDYEILHSISNDKLEFPSPEWDEISKEAKDFVTMLLQRDPSVRYSASEAAKHPWISSHFVDDISTTVTTSTSTTSIDNNEEKVQVGDGDNDDNDDNGAPDIPSPKPIQSHLRTRTKSESVELSLDNEKRTAFQKFMANIKINKAFHTIVLALTPIEAAHLGRIFDKVDQDHDGHISLEDIDDAVNAEGMFE